MPSLHPSLRNPLHPRPPARFGRLRPPLWCLRSTVPDLLSTPSLNSCPSRSSDVGHPCPPSYFPAAKAFLCATSSHLTGKEKRTKRRENPWRLQSRHPHEIDKRPNYRPHQREAFSLSLRLSPTSESETPADRRQQISPRHSTPAPRETDVGPLSISVSKSF